MYKKIKVCYYQTNERRKRRADEQLLALGYTEHSFAHVSRVAEVGGYILRTLGYSERDVELVKIAGYLHDIVNLVNRIDHSQSGAVISFRLLDKLGMEAEDIATIVSAIGNHDEGTGVPVNPVAAALILADKSDVRRSRVRNRETVSFDIHDRVNYSVIQSLLTINDDKTAITLDLTACNPREPPRPAPPRCRPRPPCPTGRRPMTRPLP